MKRILIAAMLSTLGWDVAVAQDQAEPAKKSDSVAYDYNRIQIEAPARFKELQETVLFSGPQPGEKLPSFKAVGVLKDDEYLDKEFDPVGLANGNRQIIIFQHEHGSLGILETIGFWKRLLPRIEKHSKLKLHGTVVFLGDGWREFAELARRQGMAKYLETSPFVYGYSPDGREGPGLLGLNRNVMQTIVLANDGVVVHNFTFAHPNFMPDPYVLGGVAELMGVDHGSLSQVLNEGEAEDARMRANRKMDRAKE